MFGWRARIGYLCPSVFEMIAYDFYRIARRYRCDRMRPGNSRGGALKLGNLDGVEGLKIRDPIPGFGKLLTMM